MLICGLCNIYWDYLRYPQKKENANSFPFRIRDREMGDFLIDFSDIINRRSNEKCVSVSFFWCCIIIIKEKSIQIIWIFKTKCKEEFHVKEGITS